MHGWSPNRRSGTTIEKNIKTPELVWIGLLPSTEERKWMVYHLADSVFTKNNKTWAQTNDIPAQRMKQTSSKRLQISKSPTKLQASPKHNIGRMSPKCLCSGLLPLLVLTFCPISTNTYQAPYF